MDKKYYSTRHSRLNKNYSLKRKNKVKRSCFLLRVNICLGIAILVVGAYEINSDESKKITDFVKDNITENINFEDIEKKTENLKSFVSGNSSVKAFAFSGNEVVLDDEIVEEINNNKDLYYINNSKATEP